VIPLGKSVSEQHSDRKYLSKKKNQARQVLQSFRGEPNEPIPQDTLQKVSDEWKKQTESDPSPTPPPVRMVSVLKSLNLKRHISDLQYFLHQVAHVDRIVITPAVEALVLIDRDRVLVAYLNLNSNQQAKEPKRRPFDCSYLIYQLLRHHNVPVHSEQVVCRDREYHNTVYANIAQELGLTFYPLHVNE